MLKTTPAKKFAYHAILLIAVNLFMRTIGVSFNVYLSNRAGSEVMGLYSLLSGVYTFAMTLGCGGIHLGTTRLVADVLGIHSQGGEISPLGKKEILRCLRRCLWYSLGFGTGAAILLFSFASVIGTHGLGDARTVLPLRVLALTLPPISLVSCLSGYFTAMRHITPNAVVGMVSQFIRIGACSYFLTLWLPLGVEATCLALVLGGAVSEVLGFIFTYLAYLWDSRTLRKKPQADPTTQAGDTHLTKKLFGITLPVTFSACIRSGLVTLQHMLIPRGLKASGANWSQALSSYGVLYSMVLPVVLFPSAFISSFSGLLVPEIAESNAKGDADRVARISRRIINPALFFSFGVAGIMSCFAYELGDILYHSREAGMYIRQLAPLIPIMYVDSSVDAVLKGMGEQVYSMNVNIADALISVLMVWLLLPSMGLSGYVLTIYVTETLNTTLSLARMLKVSGMRVQLFKQVFGPLLCVVGATQLIRLGHTYLSFPVLNSPISLTVAIVLASCLYIGFLMLTGVVGKEEFGVIRSLLPSLGHKEKGGDPLPDTQLKIP